MMTLPSPNLPQLNFSGLYQYISHLDEILCFWSIWCRETRVSSSSIVLPSQPADSVDVVLAVVGLVAGDNELDVVHIPASGHRHHHHLSIGRRRRIESKLRRKNPDENCYAITSFYSDHWDTIATNRHESESGSEETRLSRNKMSTLKNT